MSEAGVDSFEWAKEPASATIWTFVWAFLGGAVLGLVGAFLQAANVSFGPLTVSIPAMLVLAAMGVSARAISVAHGSRKPAVAWFVGWLLATLILALPLPGGDQVITDGGGQVIYLFGGVVLGSMLVSLPVDLRGQPLSSGAVASSEATGTVREAEGDHVA